MPITVESKPEVKERWKRKALAEGMSVGSDNEELIEPQFSCPVKTSPVGIEEIDHL